MRIAIVAGEASGDLLGSRLIKALQQQKGAEIHFEGIAGSEMMSAGCQTLHPMERLSVMGFSEVLPRLGELLALRKRLVQRWKHDPPDIFIGIDAPDFNLKLEALLHQHGIPTVHYVSPSIWAWREGRVKKFQGAVDLVLTLFPFEVDFYKKHQVAAKFVGHPLADEIPLETNQAQARKALGLDANKYTLAVLAGSRGGEIKRLAPDFLRGIHLIAQQYPDWQFVTPLINPKIRQQFEQYQQQLTPNLAITLIDGQSRKVMMAADQILMASGTATLEGLLINRPMIAAYRVAPLTAYIIRRFKMIKSKYLILPNNLCDELLVPELIQEAVTPLAILQAIEQQYHQEQHLKAHQKQCFHKMHLQLRQGASKQAAKAVLGLMASRKK
ncbi:MAG: lipid-A-disaccharide synthase [Cocleimonas sp.]|nr:lipid-A-disaccharide synthase [Cocleimonas sp.]